MSLIKHRSILAHSGKEYDDMNDYWIVEFNNYDEEGTDCVFMSEADYTDMGEPKAITITVEPGDKLNGEGQ